MIILNIKKKVNENCVVVKLNPFLTTELLVNILSTPNLKGLVLETYGFGQITIKNHKFMKILGDSIEKNSKFTLESFIFFFKWFHNFYSCIKIKITKKI